VALEVLEVFEKVNLQLIVIVVVLKLLVVDYQLMHKLIQFKLVGEPLQQPVVILILMSVHH
jgi:hypothetical protein